jgi:hypothetical protein
MYQVASTAEVYSRIGHQLGRFQLRLSDVHVETLGGVVEVIPHGRLEQASRRYDVASLINQALVQRPVLVALHHARDATQSNINQKYVSYSTCPIRNQKAVDISQCARAGLDAGRTLPQAVGTRCQASGHQVQSFRFLGSSRPA